MTPKVKKPKKMKYRTILTIAFLLLLFRLSSAQGESELRSFMKSVRVGKDSRLELTNKYGTMHINTWNKDSAYVRVELRAYGTSKEKLKKMFDGVSINFTETKDLLKVQTDLSQNFNMIFENFKGMTSKYFSYDSRIEINYFVNVPEYLNMKIENKYGDLFMDDNKGELSVSVSNGSFKANSLGKGASLLLSFCDASINSLSSGSISTSFSEVSLTEAGDVDITSISSKYEIKKAGILNTESRRDKFFIDEVISLKGSSYFTEYRVSRLTKEMTLSSKYGSIDANFIDKGFESVNINSGYTDISLQFDENSSYAIDIRHLNAFLVLPSKNVKTEEKAINQEKKDYMTFGTYGDKPGSSKVKIDATRGNIYLK